jgi:FkbM family methyltransferase
MEIMNFICNSEPARFATRLSRIANSSLPEPLKKKALWTQIKMTLLANYFSAKDQREVECAMMDRRMTAYSIRTLKYLFEEIFVGLDYFFVTDKPCPFILDCGSNIGMSIVFFKALYPGSVIIGFEPAVDSFTLLQKNIQANNLGGVTVHPFAVGEVADKVSFYGEKKAGSLLASTNPQRASATENTVEQVRLSSFIDREVDFLKLDVEGAETGVIAELHASGRIRNIAQAVIEYHHHIDKEKDHFSIFLAQLEEAGFGYQLGASQSQIKAREKFQDVVVYAYRKDGKRRA